MRFHSVGAPVRVTRREVLVHSIGLPTIVATTALPSSDAGNENLIFAQRGCYERLLLDYVHLKIGLPRPFSVLHISDTHLTAAYAHEGADKLTLKDKRTRCFGGRQEDALRDSLAWAKENTDYVVHTGDLIDWQSEANYDLVRKYFGGNMCGSMGNHEFSPSMGFSQPKEEPTESFKDVSRKTLSAVFPFDIAFQSTVVNGVNFITLDDVYGIVTEAQTERFAQEVKRGLPIVLCMHVPIYSDAIAIASYKFWMRGDWKTKSLKFTSAAVPKMSATRRRQTESQVMRDFVAMLRSERLLKAILVGHEHFSMRDDFSPTAKQYIVGGNFMFHGREFLFS